MAADGATLRIIKEIQGIVDGSGLSLAVSANERNVYRVTALIIGPPCTPYECGFFEFSVEFKSTYPAVAPVVEATTTDAGRTRFNPNIYSEGKVCLSILGTWRGEKGEGWSSAQSLESVLLSIQSLMSSNPYENEPGYENRKSEKDRGLGDAYVAKIRHETIRIAVIQKIEDYLGFATEPAFMRRPSHWDGIVVGADGDVQTYLGDPGHAFIDLCKRRFLWYFSTYLNTIDTEAKQHADGTRFTMMPFECATNGMGGIFQYGTLKKRLLIVKENLELERQSWAVEGNKLLEKGDGRAISLQGRFRQVEACLRNDIPNIEINLADGNPFTWILIYFGKPMTKIEGGNISITISISPNFPAEQPRAVVNTSIFHHRVAEDGFLCYQVQKTEDIKSHIEAIVKALEEEDAPYDPRLIVRPEASKLFWGTAEEKKHYSRRLRRSVEASFDN